MPAFAERTTTAGNAAPDISPQRLLTTRILWASLLASNFLYLGALAYVRANRTPPPPPVSALVVALALAGITNAVMSFVVPRLVYQRAALATRVDIREGLTGDPMGATQGFRTAAASGRVFSDGGAARRVAFQAFQAPFIVGMAMAEAVSLFGFVLGFLGAEWAQVLPFFAVGIAAQAVRFPTARRVEGMFEAVHGARFGG